MHANSQAPEFIHKIRPVCMCFSCPYFNLCIIKLLIVLLKECSTSMMQEILLCVCKDLECHVLMNIYTEYMAR